jgi:hypothetical protein
MRSTWLHSVTIKFSAKIPSFYLKWYEQYETPRYSSRYGCAILGIHVQSEVMLEVHVWKILITISELGTKKEWDRTGWTYNVHDQAK